MFTTYSAVFVAVISAVALMVKFKVARRVHVSKGLMFSLLSKGYMYVMMFWKNCLCQQAPGLHPVKHTCAAEADFFSFN